MKSVIMLAMLALSSGAYAQDSVNVHGFHLSPSDGDIHDPLRTWRAEKNEKNSIGFNLLGEYAYRPLVRRTQIGNQITRTTEIQDLAALNLGFFYAPHERIALTVSTPAYLAVESEVESAGVGIGDFRFAAPVTVLAERRVTDDVNFGLSVVPHLDIPGFYRDQYLRSSGISGGGVLVASLGGERWQTSINAGGHFAREVAVENLSGNERLMLSASGSYAVIDDLAVRGELTMLPTLTKNDVPWSDTPVELTGSVRGNADHVLGWTAGASTALSKGAGAATFRAFLGLDIALGARDKAVCETCDPSYITHYLAYENGESVPDSTVTINLEDVGPGEIFELEPGENIALVTVTDCPKKKVVVTDTEILLLEPIYFDFDKDTIRFPDSTAILAELVETLTDHPELTLVEVAGHTDERGSHAYNEDLSQRRMNSVVRWLGDNGIDKSRLSPVGYGERHLLDDDCGADEECHQLNRRVEFRILERESD